MFTGIVEALGSVVHVDSSERFIRLEVDATKLEDFDCKLGDSVAVNGCCLTVTHTSRLNERLLSFDISHESIDRTALGRLRTGDLVNLERAMRLGDRLGGHLVTGHIDCKAEVSKLLNIGDCWDLKVLVPREFAKYCIKKGSACLDGISLTINDIEDHQSHSALSFTIIPMTWHGTNLQRRSVNQLVNLEVDSFVKYFERLNRSIA